MSGNATDPVRTAQVVRNEQHKLLATALNNTAVATVVTGLIAPSVSYLYGLAHPAPGRFWGLIALTWLVGGVGLHLAARRTLRSLVP